MSDQASSSTITQSPWLRNSVVGLAALAVSSIAYWAYKRRSSPPSKANWQEKEYGSAKIPVDSDPNVHEDPNANSLPQDQEPAPKSAMNVPSAARGKDSSAALATAPTPRTSSDWQDAAFGDKPVVAPSDKERLVESSPSANLPDNS